MNCRERLEKYFRDNGVKFQAMTHPTVYTAQEVAAEQHVPGKQVAKVVMVQAEGEMVMLVLPASSRIDFQKLSSALGKKGPHLAKEEEFERVFPDCEVGAMPPFGNLYNVSVYVDRSLTEDSEIVFQAGTHTETMKVRFADYERLVKSQVAEFAVHL